MHIDLGGVTVDRVAELERWTFPTVEMFPAVTPALHAEPRIDLSIVTHVVKTAEAVVVVDPGNGNDKDRPALIAHHQFHADHLERLAAVVPLDDVDIVVCAHLHPDHCGGQTRLVDGTWVPNFPNARHLVARAEYMWLAQLHAAAPADGAEADLARTFADSVLPLQEAGLLELVDAPVELTKNITLRPTPGHTPGHLVAEVAGASDVAIISGDVLHHPLQFGDLDLAHAGDTDPAAAARTRRELCAQLVASGGLLLPAHFRAARVRRALYDFELIDAAAQESVSE